MHENGILSAWKNRWKLDKEKVNFSLCFLFYFSFFSSFKETLASSHGIDLFEMELCRERRYRIDWDAVVGPCKHNMSFANELSRIYTQRTQAKNSFIIHKSINPTGDYSHIWVKTVTKYGHNKTIGGDTWRVFVNGPSHIQPMVHDYQNGIYEIPILFMEHGIYNVEIILEGSLCSSYEDPPSDWFERGDYNGHFQESHMYSNKSGWPKLLEERMWSPLGGKKIVLKLNISHGNPRRISENIQKLNNWRSICQMNDCNFLWDGFGRWTKDQWKPFANDSLLNFNPHTSAKRKKTGTLWFYGDCFAYHFHEVVWNKTLCQNVFHHCNHSYNWVYPRLHPIHEKDPSIHLKDPSDLSIPRLESYLETVLKRSEMDSRSALVLNFGLHFVRATSFENFKRLIKGVIKLLNGYKGQVIWRSTTAVWKAHEKVHKRFQTYQRVLLFNAYSMGAMCKAGIPIVDVFPITASAPEQPEDGIHHEQSLLLPVERLFENYFKERPRTEKPN